MPAVRSCNPPKSYRTTLKPATGSVTGNRSVTGSRSVTVLRVYPAAAPLSGSRAVSGSRAALQRQQYDFLLQPVQRAREEVILRLDHDELFGLR